MKKSAASTSDRGPNMLEVRELHTYYDQSYVLHGVSIDVKDGQLVAVMGRNGVGKTTLVRSICGLTTARQGEVVLDGKNLFGLQANRIARAGVSLVPQGRRVFASLTVAEHLEKVVGGGRNEEHWTIERVLDVFPRLGERWKVRAGNLSGGEQSMLSISRALRLQPKLLIMDEPMEGLSPVYVSIVADVISRLRSERDLSVLVVVPEYEIALELADHIYVMSSGSIAFSGTPDELKAQPRIQSQFIGIE